MDERQHEILKFLYDKNEPVNIDNFPNRITSLFDEVEGLMPGQFDYEIIKIMDERKKWITDIPKGSNNYILTEEGRYQIERANQAISDEQKRLLKSDQKMDLEIERLVEEVINYPKFKNQQRISANSAWIAAVSASVTLILSLIRWIC